jgi:hypothetical protein
MGDAWGRPLRADVPVSCVLDAHVHGPILNSPAEVNEYLRELISIGLGGPSYWAYRPPGTSCAA